MSMQDDSGPLLVRKGDARPSIARAVIPDATHSEAVTLLLDADRHTRLRLMSVATGRTAQELLIEALDALIQSMPDVAELARRLPPRGQD